MNPIVQKDVNETKIENLTKPYPELLARKDLDCIRHETNLPVSRAWLYSPPDGLRVTEFDTRKFIWKEDLVTYLCTLVKKKL